MNCICDRHSSYTPSQVKAEGFTAKAPSADVRIAETEPDLNHQGTKTPRGSRPESLRADPALLTAPFRFGTSDFCILISAF
jgi:hypothetical protein